MSFWSIYSLIAPIIVILIFLIIAIDKAIRGKDSKYQNTSTTIIVVIIVFGIVSFIVELFEQNIL